MPDLKDPIKFLFTFENMRADADGECIVSIRVPATEFPKAARLAIMRELVFEASCTPTDVKTREPLL